MNMVKVDKKLVRKFRLSAHRMLGPCRIPATDPRFEAWLDDDEWESPSFLPGERIPHTHIHRSVRPVRDVDKSRHQWEPMEKAMGLNKYAQLGNFSATARYFREHLLWAGMPLGEKLRSTHVQYWMDDSGRDKKKVQ